MPDEARPADRWLAERYAEFYRRNPPPLPDRFGRREFGFLFFGEKSMLRHVGFGVQQEFHEFLARNGPAHTYYSTAYYQTPGARTMNEKGWMGAELIFDLDADHVPGAEKLPYRKQLELVKRHFLTLVQDFILRDFGFSEKDLLLTFSGGRGYHCHVLHEKALPLTSQERREIVDYITGTGLDLGRFIRERTLRVTRYGSATKRDTTLEIEPEDSAGWGGRINRAVRLKIEELRGAPEEQQRELFARTRPSGRFTKATFLTFQKSLSRLTPERVASGQLDSGPEVIEVLRPALGFDSLVPLAKGETDEPVTSDTKRLIRLPGSLHGKSGLRVVTLRLDEIPSFDPLTEAVAFGTDPVRIRVEKPGKVDVAGVALDLPAGEASVPEAAAVMLIARGAATPIA